MYSSLAGALSAALSGAEIRTLGAEMDGAVIVDKSVAIKGGWNADYSGKNGLPTTLKGNLTVQGGVSSAESLVVKGRFTVQRGTTRVKMVMVQP